MKTRLVSLTYRGSASVDPRYSASMLPWTINDIRSTESYTKVSKVTIVFNFCSYKGFVRFFNDASVEFDYTWIDNTIESIPMDSQSLCLLLR